MKKYTRVIARLDIKGPNVVKGVHLEGLRVVGLPELYAFEYYQQGVDELIYIDSVASLYGRNNLEEIVRKTAQQIYVPLTVGGGIRNVEDIRTLLRAGADKVAINTAAMENPRLICEGAQAFGSQCIVVSIQAKAKGDGNYECLTTNAREKTGKDVYSWAQEAYQLGAGEILITSVDRDGTGQGYDLDLIRTLGQLVPIPVIACGGAGRKEHVKDVIQNAKADAVCAASIFHYALLNHMMERNDYQEGNLDFLKKAILDQGHVRKNIQPVSVSALKEYLSAEGMTPRISQREKLLNVSVE